MPVFRFHRGGLAESMNTCVFVESKDDLIYEIKYNENSPVKEEKCKECEKNCPYCALSFNRHNHGWFISYGKFGVGITSTTKCLCMGKIDFSKTVGESKISIEKYGDIDKRIGWNTYIVMFKWPDQDPFVIGFLSENLNK